MKVPNEIVCCEKCGMWVHQSCYSIKTIPEGEWLCWPCRDQLDPDAIKCAVCPVRKGAFKKTTCGQWCHMVCAHWMPEISVLVRSLARPTFNPTSVVRPLSLETPAPLHGRQHLSRSASTPHLANVRRRVQDEDKDIAIDGLANIPKERWSMVCHVCQRKEGACIQCNYGHCQQAFHPLCARSAGTTCPLAHFRNPCSSDVSYSILADESCDSGTA